MTKLNDERCKQVEAARDASSTIDSRALIEKIFQLADKTANGERIINMKTGEVTEPIDRGTRWLDAYVAKKVAEARRDEAEHLQKQLWIIRTKFAAGKRQKARRRMDLIEKELLLPRLTELRAAADTPAQPAQKGE